MTHSLEAKVIERFWSCVDKRGPDDCWPWSGGNTRGRGLLSVAGKNVLAPRLSLLIAGKPCPGEGAMACHTCDNPECVNPAHLWWGSNQENMLDASAKGRLWQQQVTHCPKGHPYSGHEA